MPSCSHGDSGLLPNPGDPVGTGKASLMLRE